MFQFANANAARKWEEAHEKNARAQKTLVAAAAQELAGRQHESMAKRGATPSTAGAGAASVSGTERLYPESGRTEPVGGALPTSQQQSPSKEASNRSAALPASEDGTVEGVVDAKAAAAALAASRHNRTEQSAASTPQGAGAGTAPPAPAVPAAVPAAVPQAAPTPPPPRATTPNATAQGAPTAQAPAFLPVPSAAPSPLHPALAPSPPLMPPSRGGASTGTAPAAAPPSARATAATHPMAGTAARSVAALKELMAKEVKTFSPSVEAAVTNLRRLTVVVGGARNLRVGADGRIRPVPAACLAGSVACGVVFQGRVVQ